MENEINIVIAENSFLFRQALREFLERYSPFRILADVSNGRELMSLLNSTKPDIILLDISMPVMTGMEALIQITHNHPSIKCVMLTIYDDYSIIEEALQNGAKGFLMKEKSIDDLVYTVQRVHETGFYLESTLVEKILINRPNKLGTTPKSRIALLSDRENEIFELICKGLNDKEIAMVLHISPHTVHSHRSSIFAKTQTHSTSQLLLYAFNNAPK